MLSLLLPEPPGGVGCWSECVPGRWTAGLGRLWVGGPCCRKSRRQWGRPHPISWGHAVCSRRGVPMPTLLGLCHPSLCYCRPSICIEGVGLSAPPKLPVLDGCVFCGQWPSRLTYRYCASGSGRSLVPRALQGRSQGPEFISLSPAWPGGCSPIPSPPLSCWPLGRSCWPVTTLVQLSITVPNPPPSTPNTRDHTRPSP